jgi:hypothetical protein
VPETNLLSLRVACTGQAPSDECSPIAVIPRGETRYARIAGTFDPATTTFAIPGMTTASPVYARVDDTDIVTFVLTVPGDAAPGIYNVYAQGSRGLSVLSGALEVVP